MRNILRTVRAACVGFALLAGFVEAHADYKPAVITDAAPYAGFVLNGTQYDIPVFQTGKLFAFGNTDGTPFVLEVEDQFIVSISGSYNPDPFVSYSLGVTNLTGSTQSYSFTFTTPLLPTVSGPYSVFSEISGGIIDSPGGGGVAIGTNHPSNKLQTSVVGDGITNQDLSVDVGPTISTSGSASYGLFNSAAAGTVGGWTLLSLNLDFTLSAFDKFSPSGQTVLEVASIPVPAALPLLLSGALGLGLLGVGRKR